MVAGRAEGGKYRRRQIGFRSVKLVQKIIDVNAQIPLFIHTYNKRN